MADDPVPGAVDLDLLEDALASEGMPETTMTLAELDGFLVAVAVGPVPIPSEEWLPCVWGGEETPCFADEAQAATLRGGIVALQQDILDQIRDGTYLPILWRDTDGSPLPEGWTSGFMLGVALRIDAWDPLLKAEDGAMLIPILAFCDDDEDEPLVPGLRKKERERLRSNAYDNIACAAMDVAEYWGRVPVAPPMPPQQPARRPAVPGRNDPCSCGSGRKYKKCCGAAA